jgi:hypothetical protein
LRMFDVLVVVVRQSVDRLQRGPHERVGDVNIAISVMKPP